MSTSLAIVVVLASALGTYFARSGLILLLAGRTLPDPVERSLRNVGPAVLAALTVNLVVGADGIASVMIAEVAAIVVAATIAVWRRDLIVTFLGGMTTLWVLSAVM